MTLAFEAFLEQFHTTEPGAADRYATALFTGLDEHEKDIAFALLVRELPWEANWLFRLDPVKALAVARELEPRIRAETSGAYLLQQEIVRYSGDLRYQRHMVEDYAGCDESDRADVVAAIATTPANRTTIDFFKAVIGRETERRAAQAAIRPLLFALRLPRSTPVEDARIWELERLLGSEDAAERLAALEDIDAYQASPEYARRWSMDPETLLARLAGAIAALQAALPNGYTRRISAARSVGAWYDAVGALRSAAGSKELRDGAEQRVHLLCEEIRGVMSDIDGFFTWRLLPSSPRQWREWGSGAGQPRLEYGGWVNVPLLDSRLLGSTLHVRQVVREDGKERIWPDFKIAVDTAQAGQLQERFEQCRRMQAAIRARHSFDA